MAHRKKSSTIAALFGFGKKKAGPQKVGADGQMHRCQSSFLLSAVSEASRRGEISSEDKAKLKDMIVAGDVAGAEEELGALVVSAAQDPTKARQVAAAPPPPLAASKQELCCFEGCMIYSPQVRACGFCSTHAKVLEQCGGPRATAGAAHWGQLSVMLESYLLKKSPHAVLGVKRVYQRRYFVLSAAAHGRALLYFGSEAEAVACSGEHRVMVRDIERVQLRSRGRLHIKLKPPRNRTFNLRTDGGHDQPEMAARIWVSVLAYCMRLEEARAAEQGVQGFSAGAGATARVKPATTKKAAGVSAGGGGGGGGSGGGGRPHGGVTRQLSKGKQRKAAAKAEAEAAAKAAAEPEAAHSVQSVDDLFADGGGSSGGGGGGGGGGGRQAAGDADSASEEDEGGDEEDSDAGEGEWADAWDDASGKQYWYSKETGETSWTDPALRGAAVDDGKWYEAADPATGRTYFCHSESGETRWEDPRKS